MRGTIEGCHGEEWRARRADTFYRSCSNWSGTVLPCTYENDCQPEFLLWLALTLVTGEPDPLLMRHPAAILLFLVMNNRIHVDFKYLVVPDYE